MALLEAEERPIFQRIAEQAENLKQLGLSNSKIAQLLGVDDKTVVKAIRWQNIQSDSHNRVSIETGVIHWY
ncbi:MAG TPA: hypothetical protein VLB08_05935 [Candidatus Deferrimicrobium sp.]|nr:hypothetical protein [Candidatus Deferrimicrobium sp.]